LLVALHYRKLAGYKYLVAVQYRAAVPELLGVEVDHPWFQIFGGELAVEPGYAWDGASGTTLDTPGTLEASLVHDVGYQCIRAALLPAERRADVDAILYRMLRRAQQAWANNQPTAFGRAAATLWIETRALYYFAAVRAFGGRAAKFLAIEPQDQIHIV
jgi:hypothetical protein